MRKEAERWLCQAEADLKASRDSAAAARRLDTYYIPTRYPNGLDENIAPADYYDREDAEQCINFATSILTTVKKCTGH
jgi:HEPN domain-containing protein